MQMQLERDDFSFETLFKDHILEKLQETIARATGIAFVTVNYRGEPVSEMTNFCDFCKSVRADKHSLSTCATSDAYGCIQAAINKRRHIYFCHRGLLEMAVPIVVEGHYIGGFIGGQMRCDNAPKNIIRLEKLNDTALTPLTPEQRRDFEKVPKISYEKYEALAEMIELIVKNFCQSRVDRRIAAKQYAELQAQNDALKEKNEELQKQKKVVVKSGGDTSSLSTRFLVTSLISVTNLAIIEHAEKTSTYLTHLTTLLRMLFPKNRTWSVAQESHMTEEYLLMEALHLGDAFDYDISVADGMKDVQVLPFIVVPFIEQLITRGTAAGAACHIAVHFDMTDEAVRIEIVGQGFLPSSGKLQRREDLSQIQAEIAHVRSRMTAYYGDHYTISQMEPTEEADSMNRDGVVLTFEKGVSHD